MSIKVMWKKWLAIGIAALAVLLIIPYALPILFALLTAILLENAVKWFVERFHWPRFRAVLAVFICFLLFILLFSWFVADMVISQVVLLAQNGPPLANDFYESSIKPFMSRFELSFERLPIDVMRSFEQTLENALDSLTAMFRSMLEWLIALAAAIPGFLIEFLVYTIAVFFFSLEYNNLKAKVDKHLKESTKEKLYSVFGQLNKAGVGFIKAQIFLSVLTFLMAFVGLSILKVPYTALISLIIVFVDILPILGTGSVLVPWAVFSLTQGDQFLGIGLITLFVVITVVRRILEPKVFSSNMGISPLAALISLFVGFKLLGFIGFFVGPAIVIIYDTLREAGIIKGTWKI